MGDLSSGRSGCRPVRAARTLGLGDRCHGSVTAEFAVVLPVLVLMLAVVLAAGSAGIAKLRCVDAARSAARLAARHEPASVIQAAARSAGPDGSVARVSTGGGLVRVQVTARIRLPLPGRPVVDLGATSVAQLEQATIPVSPEIGAFDG
jgi:Flp pilus assembly protein TadG